MKQLGPETPVDLTSATIFEEYRDKIYRYILRLVHDPTEAEDLTQETFLRVHRKLESLRDPATLPIWLYRIATRVCYDQFRQPSYRHAVQPLDTMSGEDAEADPADESAPRLDQVIDQAEMGACVREYIEHLPDTYRTAIFLHDLHGMTNPEIARTLGCPVATVKIRLHRARLRLKEALKASCNFSSNERGVFVCERKPPNE